MDVDIDRSPLVIPAEDETMEYEDDHSHAIVGEKVEEAIMEDSHPHGGDADEVMDGGFAFVEANEAGEGMEAEPTPPLKVEKAFETPLAVPAAEAVAALPKSEVPEALVNGSPIVNGHDTTSAAEPPKAHESAVAGPSQEVASKAPADTAPPAESTQEDHHDEHVEEEQYDDEDADGEQVEGEEHDEQAVEEEEVPRIDASTLPSILLQVPNLGPRALFAQISTEGEAGPSNPGKVYLEGREEILAEASLLDVWTEIRSEIVREGGNVVGEMVLEEKQMQLLMGEDDIHIQATTLLEFLQVYLDCDLPTPVELHVKFQPSRFGARYTAIQKELAAQVEQSKLPGADVPGEHEEEVEGEAEGEEYEEYEEEVHEDEEVHAEAEGQQNEGEDQSGGLVEGDHGADDAPDPLATTETENLTVADEATEKQNQEVPIDGVGDAATEKVEEQPSTVSTAQAHDLPEAETEVEAGDEAEGDVEEGDEEYEEEGYAEGEGEDVVADGGDGPVEVEVAGEIVDGEDDETYGEDGETSGAEDAEEEAEEGEGGNDFDVDKFVEHVEGSETAIEQSADAPEEAGVEPDAGHPDEAEISPQQAQEAAKEDFVAANEAAEAVEQANEAVEDTAASLEGAEKGSLVEEEGQVAQEGEPVDNETGADGEPADDDTYADDDGEYVNGDADGEEVDEVNGDEEYYDDEQEHVEEVDGAEAGGEVEEAVPEAPSSASRKRYAAPDDDEDEDEPETKKSRTDVVLPASIAPVSIPV